MFALGAGDAVIYKPFGGVHAGPMHQEKGMLFAEIDVEALAGRPSFAAECCCRITATKNKPLIQPLNFSSCRSVARDTQSDTPLDVN
jgi:hypothetical protein